MTYRFTPAVVIVSSIVIITLAAAALLLIGRTLFCECGVIRLWSGDVLSNQNSQQFADPYTFTHILHGVGFFFLLWLVARRLPLGLRGIIAVGLESAWEIFENTNFVINRYREATLSLDYFGDSVVNSVGDILIMCLAFWLASRLPIWVTIAGIILIEVALAFWIRDGLFLNLLMLIYPIEAIKSWQLGA